MHGVHCDWYSVYLGDSGENAVRLLELQGKENILVKQDKKTYVQNNKVFSENCPNKNR